MAVTWLVLWICLKMTKLCLTFWLQIHHPFWRIIALDRAARMPSTIPALPLLSILDFQVRWENMNAWISTSFFMGQSETANSPLTCCLIIPCSLVMQASHLLLLLKNAWLFSFPRKPIVWELLLLLWYVWWWYVFFFSDTEEEVYSLFCQAYKLSLPYHTQSRDMSIITW